MAQQDKGSGGNLPIAGIVALVLFSSGLWVKHEPLQSDRPGVELKQQKERDIYQDVEARLWQDPLEAVKRAEMADEKGPAAAQDPYDAQRRQAASLRDWIGSEPGKQRLVLPVLVFGGPYADDAEQRRRTRYAVLSGLREAGYAPDNSRSIGYVRLQSKDRASPALLIPFEKWEKNKSDRTHWEQVYLLWVAEESLGLQPLQRLGEVLDLTVPRQDPKIDVTVLGPASYRMATQLAAQAAAQPALETARPGSDDKFELPLQGRPVRFIAPHLSYPTATLAQQIARDTSTEAAQQQEQEALGQRLARPMEALRLGPDDRQLDRLLLDELANRGLKLPTEGNPACDDQVALVVEADTHYARSLMREFSNLLRDCRATFRPMVFHYFRGLDGKIAQDAADSKKSSDSSARDKSKQEATPLQERAQGQGQFDYLRRMADAIKRRSAEQQREVQEGDDAPNGRDPNGQAGPARPAPQRGAVRAVIVLGSDIHDKLAILHALQESLPYTLFATTDLDAGLLQKEQLTWTRNVIVASGYDLQLPAQLKLLQKGAPPFRDSYQTASYLATRKALAHPEPRANAALLAQIDAVSRKALLFEIGNERAVALSVAPTGAAPAATAEHGAASAPRQAWGVVAKIALWLALFGVAVSWCLRQLLVDLWQRRPYAVASLIASAASLALLLAVLGFMGHMAARPGEEPLSWLDGVSVWPAALIRFGGGLLAVVLFVHGLDRLKKGERAIEAEFFKAETAAVAREEPGPRKSVRWFQETWFPSANGEERPSRNRALDVWREYKSWSRAPRCCVRVLLGVVAIMALVLVLIAELGMPSAPIRGPASGRLFLALAGPSFLVMIVMIVWTLDRVALCSLFLRRLYGSGGLPQRSGWGVAIQKQMCGYASEPTDPNAGTAAAHDDMEAAQSYIDLRLSARISRHVGGIVIYPFVLAFLLIVARARYFDNWDMTPGLLAIMVMILLLMTLGAYTMRQNAERIRRYTIEQLEALEVRLHARNYESNTETTSQQVALMRKIAVDLQEGAFAPLASQPIVRALVLPFGGAGLINLLDFILI